MYKLILLSITLGSFIFANLGNETDCIVQNTNNEKNHEWVMDPNDDNFKADARRRGGKGPRGRRRGGSGLN